MSFKICLPQVLVFISILFPNTAYTLLLELYCHQKDELNNLFVVPFDLMLKDNILSDIIYTTQHYKIKFPLGVIMVDGKLSEIKHLCSSYDYNNQNLGNVDYKYYTFFQHKRIPLEFAYKDLHIDDYEVLATSQNYSEFLESQFQRGNLADEPLMISHRITNLLFEQQKLTELDPLKYKKQVLQQINKLEQNLSSDAKVYFKHMLLLPEIHRKNGAFSPSIAVGDVNGSDARIYLSAIHAGVISLDDAGIKLLAKQLNTEYKYVLYPDGLRDFQSNPIYKERMAKLFTHATFYKNNHTELIFIGNTLYSMFANNYANKFRLVSKLHDCGVIFVRGNHDIYDEARLYLLSGKSIMVGGYVTDFKRFFNNDNRFTKDIEQMLSKMDNEIFVNSYYNEHNNMFFIYNGIAYGEYLRKNEIEGKIGWYTTAFVAFDNVPDIKTLSVLINTAKPKISKITNFKIKNKYMTDIPLFRDNNVTIVRGHYDYFNSEYSEAVINLNNKYGKLSTPIVILFN